MKKEILNILSNLMSFITIAKNTDEFNNASNYIKNIIPKNIFIKEFTFKNNKALVLSNTLNKNLDIAFCTHIDIVPSDNYNMIIKEDQIFGRGTIDMKGSLAVLIYLFKNLNTKKKIALFITSDEEIDGYSAMKLLEIYKPKLGIVPDGGTDFNLIIEEKGLLQLKITTKTKGAHAAEPFKGENAILKLINIYNELIKIYPIPKSNDEYLTSINLSKLKGGSAINKVPDYAEMILDIRHTSNDNKKTIINNIKKINTNINIIGSGPIFKTKINKEIKRYINICETVLNRKIKFKTCNSTSDAIYFSNLNIPTIIMNPKGDNAHSDNEYVNISSLISLYKIYKKFIK